MVRAVSVFGLKIVPNAELNADGEWIRVEVPHGTCVWDFEPRPGYHVVSYQTPRSLRDGGPMGATGFYPPGS